MSETRTTEQRMLEYVEIAINAVLWSTETEAQLARAYEDACMEPGDEGSAFRFVSLADAALAVADVIDQQPNAHGSATFYRDVARRLLLRAATEIETMEAARDRQKVELLN